MRRSRKRDLGHDSQSSPNYGDLQSICNGFVSALQSIATGSSSLAQPSSQLVQHGGTIANSTAEDTDEHLYEKPKKRPSVLPSAFLTKRSRVESHSRSRSATKEKLFSYDRDIICLPGFYARDGATTIKIPRKSSEREFLAKNGLIGKIRLSSDMSEREIFEEIRSVFRGPMEEDSDFRFKILQIAGGSCKSLSVPSVSSSFKWTASSVAGKNSKTPIYILAVDILKYHPDSDDDDDDSLPPPLELGRRHERTLEGTRQEQTLGGTIQEKTLEDTRQEQTFDDEVKVMDDDGTKAHNSYDVYIDLIEDDKYRSPTPPASSPITPPAPIKKKLNDEEIAEIVQMHRDASLPLDTYQYVRMIVRRRHVLQDTLDQLRSGIDISRQHFRVTFVSEPAVDSGGPMREYLHLLMTSIAKNNSLFQGEDTRRIPAHNVLEHEKNTFFHVGSIFALSLLHGGPSPSFLAPSVADYIVYGIKGVKVRVEDIPVKNVRDKIKLISESKDVSELRNLIDRDEYDFRFDIGISQPVASIQMSDKDRIVGLMVKHFTILIVKAELDQLLCGLSSTMNVLELVRGNPEMRELFFHNPKPPMTWETLYSILPAVMSQEGSNRREEEEAIMMKWIMLCKTIEGSNGTVEIQVPKADDIFRINFTLSDILMFVTGAPAPPPVGFDPSPSIRFQILSPFPSANTCSNTLYLPLRNVSHDEFNYNILFGISNAPGFGKV